MAGQGSIGAIVFAGGPVGSVFVLACLVASVTADTGTWVGEPRTLYNAPSQSTFWVRRTAQATLMTTTMSIKVTTSGGCSRVKLVVHAGCNVALPLLCTGRTVTDVVKLADGETHTMYPDVIAREIMPYQPGALNISVTQVGSSCHATVTPTIYYTQKSDLTFAPTPAPALPPATPVHTWVGDTRQGGSTDYYDLLETWVVPARGPTGFATFYSVTFEVKGTSCFAGRLLQYAVGCDYNYGLSIGAGCTGDTVSGSFLYSDAGDTVVHTNIQVDSTGYLWLAVYSYFKCDAAVTPTITYSTLPPTPAPPTQTPRTLSPPTPAPLTRAPLTLSPRTLAPLAPATRTLAPTLTPIPLAPTPGHLCPKYEAESPSTVHLVACGAAKCRAS
eukprot:Rhum_TRINITY_DN12036_c0_g1::Rhum_TRINITY_DN12036_c0_g1_i1::g.48610::m.48610